MLPWENYDKYDHESGGAISRTRVEVKVEGVTVTMTGTKHLAGVRFEHELNASLAEELGEAVVQAVNRARAHADYAASKAYLKGTGVAQFIELAPRAEGIHLRHHPSPVLSGGLTVFLERTGWSSEELAVRSGLPEKFLEDTRFGCAYPLSTLGGGRQYGILGIIDFLRPLARAFGVGVEQFTEEGFRLVVQQIEARHTKMKRKLIGLKSKRRRRSRPEGMALGKLNQMGVEAEIELELDLQEENLLRKTSFGIQFPKHRRKNRADDDFGRLLGPDGEVLLKSINEVDWKRLKTLDYQAEVAPESILERDLGWIRELLGWEIPLAGGEP